MKKQQHGVALAALLTGALVLAASPRAQAVHPNTIVDGTTLERLQQQRGQAPYLEIAQALQKALDNRAGQAVTTSLDTDMRIVANAVGGFAIAAMVLDDATYKTLAKQSLLNALSWSDWGFGEGDDLNRGHMIIAVSIAYDLLYPLLSDTERQSVRTRLGTEAQRFAAAVDSGIWWSGDFLQNHNWINEGALGLAGYALEGEDSRAAGWVQRATANSAKLKVVLDLVSDGSWHEGVGYQQYGWSMSMPFMLAAARRGTDVSNQQMLKAYGRYRLAVGLPSNGRQYVMTHGDWSGYSGPGSAQVLRYAANRFHDPVAQEAARRWIAAGSRSTQPGDTLYAGLEMIALDPALVPDASSASLDFYGDDQQLALFRSDWTSSALVVGFKSGVLGGRGNFERLKSRGYPGGSLNIGHDHMDDLGLWLFGDGEWLLPECVGYNIGRTSGPMAWMTEFHNALLFDGAGELGDDRGAADDGLSHPWFFQREADLPLFASTQHYGFARGDGTRLYPGTLGLQGLFRTIGFSREGYLTLRDDVRLTAAHQVEQLFHFMDSATTSGAWVRGNTKNDRVLGVRVVSPAQFSTTIASQTADKLTKQFEPDGSVSQVKLRPTTNAAATSFLEVLWPTRGTKWDQRPDIQPLDAAHPEVGLRVPLATASERWVYAPASGTQTAGDLTLTGDLGVVRLGLDGSFQRAVLVGRGSITDQNGARLLVSTSDVGVLEVSMNGTVAELSGTGATGARFYGPTVTDVRVDGASVAFWREGSTVIIGQPPPPPPPPVVVQQDPPPPPPQDPPPALQDPPPVVVQQDPPPPPQDPPPAIAQQDPPPAPQDPPPALQDPPPPPPQDPPPAPQDPPPAPQDPPPAPQDPPPATVSQDPLPSESVPPTDTPYMRMPSPLTANVKVAAAPGNAGVSSTTTTQPSASDPVLQKVRASASCGGCNAGAAPSAVLLAGLTALLRRRRR